MIFLHFFCATLLVHKNSTYGCKIKACSFCYWGSNILVYLATSCKGGEPIWLRIKVSHGIGWYEWPCVSHYLRQPGIYSHKISKEFFWRRCLFMVNEDFNNWWDEPQNNQQGQCDLEMPMSAVSDNLSNPTCQETNKKKSSRRRNTLQDVISKINQLTIMGPLSRPLLKILSTLSNSTFLLHEAAKVKIIRDFVA